MQQIHGRAQLWGHSGISHVWNSRTWGENPAGWSQSRSIVAHLPCNQIEQWICFSFEFQFFIPCVLFHSNIIFSFSGRHSSPESISAWTHIFRHAFTASAVQLIQFIICPLFYPVIYGSWPLAWCDIWLQMLYARQPISPKRIFLLHADIFIARSGQSAIWRWRSSIQKPGVCARICTAASCTHLVLSIAKHQLPLKSRQNQEWSGAEGSLYILIMFFNRYVTFFSTHLACTLHTHQSPSKTACVFSRQVTCL